jgi:hypothetical protein
MINFTQLALREFDTHLMDVFSNDSSHVETVEILRKMANISYTHFTKSNSIYFTLGHSLSASLVGIGIIDAMKCQYGFVRESEAINLMASIFFCNIGIIYGVLKDDKDGMAKISASESIDMSNFPTTSGLWKYKPFRSKEFIKESPFVSSNINNELVNRAIEVSDLTSSVDNHQNIGEINQLVRASEIISLMADENINRRQVEFYLSAIEGSAIDPTLFKSLGDFRDKFRNYFWEVLYPDVGDVLLLLRETINGRKIVSKIYAHL